MRCWRRTPRTEHPWASPPMPTSTAQFPSVPGPLPVPVTERHFPTDHRRLSVRVIEDGEPKAKDFRERERVRRDGQPNSGR
jgi:hypothetical protein